MKDNQKRLTGWANDQTAPKTPDTPTPIQEIVLPLFSIGQKVKIVVGVNGWSGSRHDLENIFVVFRI